MATGALAQRVTQGFAVRQVSKLVLSCLTVCDSVTTLLHPGEAWKRMEYSSPGSRSDKWRNSQTLK